MHFVWLLMLLLLPNEAHSQWFATPKNIAEFFGPTFSLEHSGDVITATTRPDKIWDIEAAVSQGVLRIDSLGKWLQKSEGQSVTAKTIKIAFEAPKQDRYGNTAGHALLYILTVPVAELRKINYDSIARYTVDLPPSNICNARARWEPLRGANPAVGTLETRDLVNAGAVAAALCAMARSGQHAPERLRRYAASVAANQRSFFLTKLKAGHTRRY